MKENERKYQVKKGEEGGGRESKIKGRGSRETEWSRRDS